MKLWNARFAAALILVVVFLLAALRLGLRNDPRSGEPIALLPPEVTDSSAASFVFLILVLYVVSHAGSWVMAKFRGAPPRDREQEGKKRQEGRRGRKQRSR